MNGGYDGEHCGDQFLALGSIAAQVVVCLLGGVPDNSCADMQDQYLNRGFIVGLVSLLPTFLSLVELKPGLVT